MNENKNPEIIPDEEAAVEQDAEKDLVEETVSEADEPETEETAAETVDNAEKTESDDSESNSLTSSEELEAEASDEEKPKKKRRIQTPVIISACLVLAVLIAYFVYTGFFLKEPEGVTWSVDLPMLDSEGNLLIDDNGNNVTSRYYFEFDKDNTFRSYMGSAEIEGKYNKEKGTENGDTLSVSVSAGVFYAGIPSEYTITGSRILNNQEMHVKLYDGSEYTLSQSKRELPTVELPNDFTADEKLLGEWVAMDMGMEICRVNFSDNGYMTLKFLDSTSSYSQTFNGSYTIGDNSTLNFTYYTSSKPVAAPLQYQFVDDNTLYFIGAYFVRPDSLATADQASK